MPFLVIPGVSQKPGPALLLYRLSLACGLFRVKNGLTLTRADIIPLNSTSNFLFSCFVALAQSFQCL